MIPVQDLFPLPHDIQTDLANDSSRLNPYLTRNEYGNFGTLTSYDEWSCSAVDEGSYFQPTEVEQELFNNYLTADISDASIQPYTLTALELSFASITSQAYAVALPGIPHDTHSAIVPQVPYSLLPYVASTAEEVYSQPAAVSLDMSTSPFLDCHAAPTACICPTLLAGASVHDVPQELYSTPPLCDEPRSRSSRASDRAHARALLSSPYPPSSVSSSSSSMSPSPSLTFASSSSPSPSLLPFPSPSPPQSTLRACTRRNVQVSPSTVRSAPTVPGNPWKCPHCPYVQRTKRSPDLKRHIATHMRPADVELWVCCGVPVSDAAEYGVPAEYMRDAAPCEYEGMLMVGGCKKTFSRRDALKRHLRAQRGRCYGDALAVYLPGNRKMGSTNDI